MAIDKKAALAAYREQKALAGVYAVRCAASGQVWVGQAPNIDKIQNRLWFSLRQGSPFHADVQAAWNAHGEDAMSFEILELIDEDTALGRSNALKDRLAHWRDRLGGLAL